MPTHPDARLTPLGRERFLHRTLITAKALSPWLAAAQGVLLDCAMDLRYERCTLGGIARVLAAPLSTVAQMLKALGPAT
jgi:hypothetical protein